jgi:hypothetical protein
MPPAPPAPSLFERIGTAVSNAVSTVSTAVRNTVSTVSNTVTRAVSTASTAVRNTVSSVATTVRNTASTVTSAVSSAASRAYSAATDFVDDARTTIGNGVTRLTTAVSNTASSVAATVRNTASTVSTAARNTTSQIASTVSGAASRVASGRPNATADETPIPPDYTPTPTSTPTFASAPLAPIIQATPTANELAARFAAAKEARTRLAAVAEQRAFEADPMAFVLAEAVPYYNQLLREKYQTTLQEVVNGPGNNPITDSEIDPGLVPAVATGLGGANALFLDSLELDTGHYPNYDPVYLNALREIYPDQYQDALASKEEDAGAGDLLLRLMKFLPYD